ncbi:YsnF/AvaK domain-containing protein, partial [Muricoccus pecuniae]
EARIPIVEEHIQVGKREVEHGRVRVRSYVVETPVNEQVTLREEHVDVTRRPVDRPLTDADDAFRERVIEATEHAEEAVVSKEARVTEELVIRKEASERAETVNGTVRSTKVEVEDSRTAGMVSGTRDGALDIDSKEAGQKR